VRVFYNARRGVSLSEGLKIIGEKWLTMVDEGNNYELLALSMRHIYTLQSIAHVVVLASKARPEMGPESQAEPDRT